jgi:transmembrane sensor
MTGADETIFEKAAAWHLASGRDDRDWDGFTLWLEADPRHRAAYEEVALTDAALECHRDALAPLVRDETEAASNRPRRQWPLWAGGAAAAALVAVLVVPQFVEPQPQSFATGATRQTIALANGSRIVLAPHSRLTLSGRHSDQLALEGGAYFDIRHDPQRPLAIRANELEIGDIGTRFEVQTNEKAVRVEVSQGKVEVHGDALGRPVELAAGHRILFDPAHGLATIASVAAAYVGEWREGRLSYDAAPLSLVASDLSRYAGVAVAVPPALSGRRFSGTLSIQDGHSAVRDLAQLMGLELSRGADAYRLSEPG